MQEVALERSEIVPSIMRKVEDLPYIHKNIIIETFCPDLYFTELPRH